MCELFPNSLLLTVEICKSIENKVNIYGHDKGIQRCHSRDSINDTINSDTTKRRAEAGSKGATTFFPSRQLPKKEGKKKSCEIGYECE